MQALEEERHKMDAEYLKEHPLTEEEIAK